MKMLTYSGAALALAALLSTAPSAALAVNITSEATGALEATMDLSDTDVDTTADANIEVDATTTASSSGDVEGNAMSSDISLRLNVDGEAIVRAVDVESDDDLEIYAYNVAVRDEMVEEVKTETTDEGRARVEVVYKHQGELFGILPVTIKSTTVVTSGQGRVEVESTLPWWSAIATKKNYAASEIEARIKDNATIMTSAEMEADARTRAAITEAVIFELEAHSKLHASIND